MSSQQTNLPIGLRNNNPGNLRPTGENWKGMTGVNGGFMVFSSMAYGVRAWFIDLHTDITKNKQFTLRDRVKAYAPASENDTASYLRSMEKLTGLKADVPFPRTKQAAISMFKAHMIIENGKQHAGYIKDSDIEKGWELMPGNKRAFFLTSTVCSLCGQPLPHSSTTLEPKTNNNEKQKNVVRRDFGSGGHVADSFRGSTN